MAESIEMPFGVLSQVNASINVLKVTVEVGFFYSATYATLPRPTPLYNRQMAPAEEANIRLQLTTQFLHLERMKGCVGLVG